MAITQRDYRPGVFEVLTGEPLGNAVLSVSQYFTPDGYFKLDMSDIIIRVDSISGDVLALGSDYSLTIDQKTGDIPPVVLQVELHAATGRDFSNGANLLHHAVSSRLNHIGSVSMLRAVLRVTAMA